MELENIMLNEISQTQKNQKLNVFFDTWKLIHNARRQGEALGKNRENRVTLDYLEGSEGRGKEWG